jgi:hypothetical protein
LGLKMMSECCKKSIRYYKSREYKIRGRVAFLGKKKEVKDLQVEKLHLKRSANAFYRVFATLIIG